MKINVVHTWPESKLHQLVGVLLAGEAQEKYYVKQIDEILGYSSGIKEAHGEKGHKRLHISGGKTILSLGIGVEAELELFRKATYDLIQQAQGLNYEEVVIITDNDWGLKVFTSIAESILLSSYSFEKYKSKKAEHTLKSIVILMEDDQECVEAFEEGLKIGRATCIARDLVNEPVITLTAQALAKRIEELGETYGFKVDVWHKPKIEAMKMGGLLAVNAGSQDPPTFSILEYKPKNYRNKKPIILVGKGVVFDTGGLSLKPTANSMDFMKADMGGAAAVVGAFCGIAALKLNYHVIGLIPATDNRPGQRAYTPGDVIHMHDGSTVEVLNTDAEGRMILADALSFAKRYDPEVVIDLATLTGAAVVAVGNEGIALMGTKSDKAKKILAVAGEIVHERLVEFPLWNEYKEQLKSDIADLKNIGGRGAGAITAGKFLEHFTDYPWIHLDIAGASWLSAPNSYRGKNGTGVGVRLLIEFISTYY